MFVYLVTFCIVSVLFRFCFFDNFFALLHVLTNQSRYKYVSLYWVHSASYLTLMNKVLLEEVDSRSYPYPRKKSHNTGADIQIDFSSHNYSPDFILLWYPPLFSSWNSFIKTFVAGQPLKVIAFWIQLFVWLYYLIKSLVLVSKQVAKMVSRRRYWVKIMVHWFYSKVKFSRVPSWSHA